MCNNVFESMDEALYKGIAELLNKGYIVSPRDLKTLEVLGYSFVLTNPRARLINISKRNWSFAYALGELCWHLNGSNNLNDIEYYSKAWRNFSISEIIEGSCYGKKIFESTNSESYWDRIKKLLKNDLESRRAILVLNDKEDIYGKDVSCVTSIQFIVRDNKLNCITNMRSNDIIWGMCYDVFFITFLQEMLSAQLDLDLGWYMHSAASFHLYEKNFSMANSIIEEGMPKQIIQMAPMRDLDYIASYLNIEKEIRCGKILSEEEINKIPEYWRHLVIPLNNKRKNQQSKDTD